MAIRRATIACSKNFGSALRRRARTSASSASVSSRSAASRASSGVLRGGLIRSLGGLLRSLGKCRKSPEVSDVHTLRRISQEALSRIRDPIDAALHAFHQGSSQEVAQRPGRTIRECALPSAGEHLLQVRFGEAFGACHTFADLSNRGVFTVLQRPQHRKHQTLKVGNCHGGPLRYGANRPTYHHPQGSAPSRVPAPRLGKLHLAAARTRSLEGRKTPILTMRGLAVPRSVGVAASGETEHRCHSVAGRVSRGALGVASTVAAGGARLTRSTSQRIGQPMPCLTLRSGIGMPRPAWLPGCPHCRRRGGGSVRQNQHWSAGSRAGQV